MGTAYYSAGAAIVSHFAPPAMSPGRHADHWEDELNLIAAILAWRKFHCQTVRAAVRLLSEIADDDQEQILYAQLVATRARLVFIPLNRALAERPELSDSESKTFIQRWLASRIRQAGA